MSISSFWEIVANASTALFTGVAVTLTIGNLIIRLANRRVAQIEHEINRIEKDLTPELDRRLGALVEIVDAQRALVHKVRAELERIEREMETFDSTPADQMDLEAYADTKRRFVELKRTIASIEEALLEADTRAEAFHHVHGRMGVRIAHIRSLQNRARWLFRLAELAGNVEIPARRRS